MTTLKLDNATRRDNQIRVAAVKKSKKVGLTGEEDAGVASETDDQSDWDIEEHGVQLPNLEDEKTAADVVEHFETAMKTPSPSPPPSNVQVQEVQEEVSNESGLVYPTATAGALKLLLKEEVREIVKEVIKDEVGKALEIQAEANRLFLENALREMRNTSIEMVTSAMNRAPSGTASLNSSSMSTSSNINENDDVVVPSTAGNLLLGNSVTYTLPIQGRDRCIVVNDELTDDADSRHTHVSFLET
jgi:hypothetical protein